uniref:Bulb-type lectin domain-containing protein n=1 Tax=Hucho hucho TaxID=62062 RepID=A0A4W5NX48_9TELE
MSRNYMSKYDDMRNVLMSNNHEWKACFQEDGNFVIYGRKPMDGEEVWSSAQSKGFKQ